jgi:hypothetical protein
MPLSVFHKSHDDLLTQLFYELGSKAQFLPSKVVIELQ